MSDDQLENKITVAIKNKRDHPKTFSELIMDFESKFSNFNPTSNCFNICEYFGTGQGVVTSKNKLLNDGKIKSDWLRVYETKDGKIKEDFKGLYIFINGNTPFYVGISKSVIERLSHHVKGSNHNTATLAYNIGLIRHELMTGQNHIGKREAFPFKTEVEPAKKFLLKQKIALFHIDNDEELYLFEIFCSMKLQTSLNKFETH